MSRVIEKPTFCICENKDADLTAKLISAFDFAIRIVDMQGHGDYLLRPRDRVCPKGALCIGLHG